MYSTLLIITLSALLGLALGLKPGWAGVGRWIGPVGIAGVLGVALWREGVSGGGVVGRVVGWPQPLLWLGEPVYRTDALAVGLGAWCLLLGGVCLLKMAFDEEAPWRIAVSTLTVGTLYSLVHTDNLAAFTGQVVFLALLLWTCRAGDRNAEEIEGEVSANGGYGKQTIALGIGAIALLGATLLMGRTTGGDYSLLSLSLSALTVWPLLLLAAFAVAWLGLLPFTGWSAAAQSSSSAHVTLMQSLVVGVPVITLMLRLEGLLSAQALVGTLPPQWGGFTLAISWLGGLTALVAAAGMLVWAGTERWTAMLTAYAMGLALWGLGLDTPLGRYAAVATLLAYGAGRVAYRLTENTRLTPEGGIARASLGAAPLTMGFVGVWLLGAALSEMGSPILVVALAGMAILAACGVLLQAATARHVEERPEDAVQRVRWLGWTAAATLVLGGTLPYLWLPLVSNIVSIAGGSPGIITGWTGLRTGDGTAMLALLAVGVAGFLGLGWVVRALTRARAVSSGTLLPTGLERLAKWREDKGNVYDRENASVRPLPANAPTPVRWLSLLWLEEGIERSGSLLGRLGARSGRLLGLLEGRFYLPLALILALLLVLAVTG